MTSATQARRGARDLLLVAAWVGLATGMVEGVGWLIIQRLGRLTGLWTQVLWIAPVLDGLVLVLVALGLAATVRLVPQKWWWPMALFIVAAAAAINFVSLVLGPYLYRSVLVILALGIATALVRGFRAREASVLRFFGRTLPHLVGLVIALFAGIQAFYSLRERAQVNALPEGRSSDPDVVVLIIDALRADHLSAYGYDRPTSPFLDELAAGGVLFERAISASPYSLPSHASMLSGLFPSEHGVEWLEFKVFQDADYPSIAEAMQERGYRTGAFSANTFWFTREQGFGRGFIRFEDFYQSVPDMAYRTVFGNNLTTVKMLLGFDQVPARQWASDVTSRVLAWARRDGEHPLLAVINYFDVHAPYTPPQPYRGRFSEEDAPGGTLNWLMDRRGDLQLTPAERQSEIDGYDGAIAYVDDQIRRLWEGLREARPGRELIVVVTSDHGEAFGEHGGYLHARSLYREELHIPLILHGPGVPAGVRISRPVTHAAIPATVLDLVSDGPTQTFGARSLVDLWAQPTEQARWAYPLAEAGERGWAPESFPTHHGDMWSLLSPEWHFIGHETLAAELYAWEDALEQHDRAADPELHAVLDEFRSLGPRPAGR